MYYRRLPNTPIKWSPMTVWQVSKFNSKQRLHAAAGILYDLKF